MATHLIHNARFISFNFPGKCYLSLLQFWGKSIMICDTCLHVWIFSFFLSV